MNINYKPKVTILILTLTQTLKQNIGMGLPLFSKIIKTFIFHVSLCLNVMNVFISHVYRQFKSESKENDIVSTFNITQQLLVFPIKFTF